jgi:hypothetical protein
MASVSSIVADLEKFAAEAKAAAPELETVAGLLEKIKPLVPAEDQPLFADGEAALAALIAVLKS